MISKKVHQCPQCGHKVFSSYDKQGWRILCGYCVYEAKAHPTEVGAEKNYRDDFNEAFAKGICEVPLPQERGWTRVSDRLPTEVVGGDGADHRKVDVKFSDGFITTLTVDTLLKFQGETTMEYWRWKK